MDYIDSLRALSGKKTLLTVFLYGILMAAAMPPLGCFPVLLVCVPACIHFTRTAGSKGRAFLTGWLFGAGYFIAGLYWISNALFVDIAQWGWLLPFSALLGPAVVGLYYGFIPLAAWRCREKPAAYAFAVVAAWAGIEWLRGHLFTGFPWNLPGYAWSRALPVEQIAAYTGVYGLTLLTLLWSLPLFMPERRQTNMVLIVSFSAVVALGLWRLDTHRPLPTAHTVRIVQPNLPQSLKWDRAREWENLGHTLALTGRENVDFYIWPETALTFSHSGTPGLASYIAEGAPAGSTGISGNLRYEQGENGLRFYNSVTVIDDTGHAAAIYDKHHLVPFGEYVPFRNVIGLTPVAAAISGLSDFQAGPGPRTMRVGDMPPFSPLVCYEVIFPHAVADQNDRPQWLVNVTNDGWYGHSAGPYQHFEISRMRAIEEGLPLARAANTGISAMIGPAGQVLQHIPLGVTGRIDTPLPEALPPTVYARFGDTLFFVMLLLVAGYAGYLKRQP